MKKNAQPLYLGHAPRYPAESLSLPPSPTSPVLKVEYRALQDQVRLYVACICSILNVVSGLAGGKSVAEQVRGLMTGWGCNAHVEYGLNFRQGHAEG
jgi:hypothetical protein